MTLASVEITLRSQSHPRPRTHGSKSGWGSFGLIASIAASVGAVSVSISAARVRATAPWGRSVPGSTEMASTGDARVAAAVSVASGGELSLAGAAALEVAAGGAASVFEAGFGSSEATSASSEVACASGAAFGSSRISATAGG